MTTLESYQLYYEEVSGASKINTRHIANLRRQRTKKGKDENISKN